MDICEAIDCALAVKAAYSGECPGAIGTVMGDDLATDKDFAPKIVPFGFVTRAGGKIVVAIRGTEGIFEWMDDLCFEKVRCPIEGSEGQTEDGFSDVYMSLTVEDSGLADFLMRQTGEILIAGHSLGAALATLLAYDLGLRGRAATLYAFASPNVGDRGFASSFQAVCPKAFRVVNPFDVVTHVPLRPVMGYENVGTTVSFPPGGKVKAGIACFHSLESYLLLMGNGAGAAGCQPG